MSNQETPDTNIGNLKTDEELAEQELEVLAEANKIADEVEDSEAEINEEVERILKENPNLVYEPNPNLIGNGVEVSPQLMEWALAHGVMSKVKHRKAKPTKSTIGRAERTKKRKAKKKARKKNRK